jgi:undecaprenyl diphosphate synthase
VGEYGVSEVGDSSSLRHVVLVGGTPHQWFEMNADQWRQRIADVCRGTAVAHPRWVTLMPHSGVNLAPNEFAEWLTMFEHDVKATSVTAHGWTRHVFETDDAVSVIVDPCADGRHRFASLLEHVRRSSIDIEALTENDLAALVLAPAETEPDLVVILGPADRVPTSLVWELGYSELVFLDLAWTELEVSHLEVAVDDFHRRQRRFGGLDS